MYVYVAPTIDYVRDQSHGRIIDEQVPKAGLPRARSTLRTGPVFVRLEGDEVNRPRSGRKRIAPTT